MKSAEEWSKEDPAGTCGGSVEFIRRIQHDALMRAVELVNEARQEGETDLRSLREWIRSAAPTITPT